MIINVRTNSKEEKKMTKSYMNSNYPASSFWWTFGQGSNPTLAQLEAALA